RFGAFLQAYAGSLHLGDRVQVRTIAPQDAHLLHAAADVFVAPTDNIQETFGLTPVEAMACGVPVVVSDWNGYKDTVRHEETGFLIPTLWAPVARDISEDAFLGDAPFDHFALAQSVVVRMDLFQQAVQRLIDEEGLRNAMGTHARKHVEACFSWEVVIAHYEALWEELVAQCQALDQPASMAPMYAKPLYGRAFQHYASEMLSDDLVVILSSRGQQYVDGKSHMPLHQQLGEAIDPAILQRILKGIIYAETHHQQMSVARLVHVITARSDAPYAEDVVRRHVLWLLKYGYLHGTRPEDGEEGRG
ncbi:MAG TPA: glycosyltransferase family 4 protein, partial [Rhodothermales bacterium]|nr:glycosyltransferase family 4 protein [Rhodothermales bacterium]